MPDTPDENRPFLVKWTAPVQKYADRLPPGTLLRPAGFLVMETPTRTRLEHLRVLWADWVAQNPVTIPRPENPADPAKNNRGFYMKRKPGESELAYDRRRTRHRASLGRGEIKIKNRPNPGKLPPHRFVPSDHTAEDCGPIWPPDHPNAVKLPETPKPRRGRKSSSSIPATMQHRHRSRWSFRIPATLIRGIDPSLAYVPPLSLTCDPNTETGETALAVATKRWLAHANAHYAHAELETGHAVPLPKRLPRGTVKTYAGLAGRKDFPLSFATVPPPLPDPFATVDKSAPKFPAPKRRRSPNGTRKPRKKSADIRAALDAETPKPAPPRVNTEAPIYLAYEDEQAPRDRRTIEHREYVQRVADAIEAGAYDPEDPWKRTPSPNR